MARRPPSKRAKQKKENAIPMDSNEVDKRIRSLIEPFNKKGVTITDATTFANDLEFDSLTVMDFVAEIEDEFDIIISMNQQAEIENYGLLVAAVHKLQDK
ncbi:MAG: acyl carrier protein [Hyphomicrobiales bacterium]